MATRFMNQLTEGKEEKAKIRDLNKKIFKKMSKYIFQDKVCLSLAFLMTIITAAAAVLPPYLEKKIIDDYILLGDFGGMVIVLFVYLSVYGLGWASMSFQTYFAGKVGQGMVKSIREDLYFSMIARPLLFFEKEKKGKLSSVMTNDVNAISDFIKAGLINLLSDLLSLAGIIAFMLYLNVKLTLLMMVVLPLVFFIIFILGKKIRKAYTEVREKIADLNASVEENLSGIRVIQSFGKQEKNTFAFNQINASNMEAGMKAMILISLFFPLIALTNSLGYALIIGIGGVDYARGEITLGVLVAFLSYMRRFFVPLRDLSQVYNIYQAAAAAFIRISHYLQESDYNFKKEANQEKQTFLGGIEIHDLDFAYGERPILKKINLKIEPGEKVGIVGETGAGKSTLVNVIAGLYEAEKGKIKIGEQFLEKISNFELRKNLSLVSQEPFIFNSSVLENLQIGDPKATKEDIIAAAKKTKAHDFIEKLPQGYQTILSESGHNLSGGQKQMLAFARVILRDPQIIILDEATSSLDAETERDIQTGLNALLEKRTALIIAHRLQTLHDLDKILIIADGKIVAEGDHEALLKENDYYQNIYEKQFVKRGGSHEKN